MKIFILLVRTLLPNFIVSYLLVVTYYFLPLFVDELLGAGRKPIPPLSWGEAGPNWEGVILPSYRGYKDYRDVDEVKKYLMMIAEKPLLDWDKHGKGHSPYVCLARLACEYKVEEVNQYLQKVKPWSGSGSTWWGYRGDYDFTEVILTRILYMFGGKQELIYPETLEHLLNVLLVEEGGKPREMVPRSLGLVQDTENHHLMTESSRYLKNQWLFKYGSSRVAPGDPEFDNKKNGLEDWLESYLEEMLSNGEYEFNSIPYLIYTVEALLNLVEFPDSDDIKVRAHRILDALNWRYALGSLQFRRYAPFRRRFEYANTTSLVSDPHTALMRWWCYPESGGAPGEVYTRSSQVIFAVLSPYTLPPVVKRWAVRKPYDYFVQIGFGKNGSPEIHSGGPDYLISAGGVYRGLRAMVIPRPTTLLLNDGETDINRCFHIKGRGRWWCWNNTGVYKRFAVGNAPVYVPPQYSPVAQYGGWSIFAPECAKNLYICIYNEDEFGLLYLAERGDRAPDKLVKELIYRNPSPVEIYSVFTCLDETKIEYEVNAPAGVWVIKSINGVSVNRFYDTWDRWSGNVPVNLYSDS